MNFTKKVALFAILLATEQASYSSAEQSNIKGANQLVAESYVTPEMQWAVFEFMKKPFAIDTTTGIPAYSKEQSMPSVEEILAKVLPSQSQNITLKALEASLSAVKTAIFVAALEASYDTNKQNFYWYQTANENVTSELHSKKSRIESLISLVTRSPQTGGAPHESFQVREEDTTSNTIMISPEDVHKIINDNSFKALAANPNDRVKIQQAATLLFKECFIAQQNITIPKKWISIHNSYIFGDDFPNMNQLIDVAKGANGLSQKHEFFQYIRQAVQTALFIAKQNSTYYVTTDPLVQALKDMDTRISEFYMNPLYGATPDDLGRAQMWSNLTNIAAGAAVVGAAGAAYYASQNPEDVKAIAQQAQDFVGKQTTYLSEQASNAKNYMFKQEPLIKEEPSIMDKMTNKAIEVKSELQKNTTKLINGLGFKTEVEPVKQDQSWSEYFEETAAHNEKMGREAAVQNQATSSDDNSVTPPTESLNIAPERSWSDYFEELDKVQENNNK